MYIHTYNMHVHTCTDTHTHIYTHVHTHTHTHVHRLTGFDDLFSTLDKISNAALNIIT